MAGGLTRWDPLAEITHVRSRFDRLLDELGGQDHGAWMPAIDLCAMTTIWSSAWICLASRPDGPSRAQQSHETSRRCRRRRCAPVLILHGGDCNLAERTGPYHEVLAVDGQTLELFVRGDPWEHILGKPRRQS